MDQTIAAVATPYGEGGIGIIRISGEESLRILNEIFKPAKRENLMPRMLTYGQILVPETREILDEVLAVFMKGPATYTAEDVVEIHCHGSVVALRRVLSLILERGARLAEPGEFTKRAFLNGRLDLVIFRYCCQIVRTLLMNPFGTVMPGTLVKRSVSWAF